MEPLIDNPTTLKIVAYTADPWESVLPLLRYRSPARQIGISVTRGNQGPNIDVDLVNNADIVLIQRDFPRFFEACVKIIEIARGQNKPVIYEIDDLLFELSSAHSDAWQDLGRYLHQMLWTVMEADLITTSTANLKDYLSAINPNVSLLPNYLEDTLWHLRPPKGGDDSSKTIIGYMGGSTHLQDIKSIEPVLSTILQVYGERIQLRFWGSSPPKKFLSHGNVDWTPINLLDYSEFASYFNQQDCDILIAPLDDNRFNQGKSSLKFLEYSCLGIPAIYSQIQPYSSIVNHGENGYLASTPSEWEHWLAYLIENPQARIKIAACAQETTRDQWLLSDNAYKWQAAYNQAIQLAESRRTVGLEHLAILSSVSNQANNSIQHLEQRLADHARKIYSLQHEINTAQAAINLKITENANFRNEIMAKENEKIILQMQLNEILHSRSWRLITRLQSLKNIFLPPKR